MSNARDFASRVPVDGALSNRNMIINGDFQVSQRGDFTSPYAYSSAGYAVDRWKLYDVGCDGRVTHKIKQLVDGRYTNTLYLECVTGGTGRLISRQLIEQPSGYSSHQLDGVTGTVSGWVKSNSPKARIYIYAGFYVEVAHSGNGQWEYLTATITGVPANSPIEVGVQIDAGNNNNTSISAGDYFEIAYMQLEYGSTATPFEHRSYGDELARCQRYFHREKGPVHGKSMWTYSGTRASSVLNLPVAMRARPTFTYNATLEATLSALDSICVFAVTNWKGCSSITSSASSNSNTRSVRLDAVFTTSITNGLSAGLYMNPDAYLDYDAEL